MLTSRQRVLAALEHRQPDRVPLDLGSTIVTSISIPGYRALKAHLGTGGLDVRPFDRTAQVAAIDEEILERFQIDTRGVLPGTAENRPSVELPEEYGFMDEWGLLRKMPPGAESYFIANAPLAGERTIHDVLTYAWPDPADPGRTRGLRQKILDLRARGNWAIVLALPGNFIATSMLLRGFEDWYMDTASDQALACALMDQVLEIQMEMCAGILAQAGELVDVVINLDDLAMQDRLMVSLPTYGRLLEPRLHRFYAFVHSRTQAKILHHSDGAVEPLLDSLIEMGVDAVNPLQVTARGMGDLPGLKARYAGRLAFWGGIDTQQLLPCGTPQDVRREVRRTVETMSAQGGYVLASVHNIQSDVPPENITAMFEAARPG